MCPVTDFLGNSIYNSQQNEPDQQEIERRKDTYFWPYHHKIHEQIQKIKDEFGQVLFWDAHSIRRNVKTIRKELTRIGYNVHVQLLNSKHYGIPQNRERVWIYATKKQLPLQFSLAPKKIKLKNLLPIFLDKDVDQNLYLSTKQINRLIELHNVDFNVEEHACFDVYNKKVRTDGVCMTLTEPHHNSTRIVEPPKNGNFIVRKLSTTEHFRLMGFDDNGIDFSDLSYSQICKRAGNGWDINVAGIILKNIYSFAYE